MSVPTASSCERCGRAVILAAAVLLVVGELEPDEAAAQPRPAPAASVSTAFGAAAWSGRPLAEALLELRRRGLRIVFTDRVVRAEMTVLDEPAAVDARSILEQLLAPHALAARTGPQGTLVVVERPRPAAELPAPEATAPLAAPVFTDEMVVTPSRVSLLRDGDIGTLALDRDQILGLPHLGDDFFRALSLLPGTAANDVSAELHVRGGRRDETQILLDGQELFDPFHLQDYDRAASAVAPATLAGAELATGGFAARFGDRMSGVLDLTTVSPGGDPRFHLGVGILGVRAGAGGALPGERGSWLVEARRGTVDLIGRTVGAEDPGFWDTFGKVDLALGTRSSLRAHLLHAEDELDFDERIGDETKRFRTQYRSSQTWLALQTLIGRNLLCETAAASARIDRNRGGAETEEEGEFAIHDRRASDFRELRQDCHLEAPSAHALEWGWQARSYRTDYDYFGTRELDDPLAVLRHDAGESETDFRGRFEERHRSAYLSDRFRAGAALALELGLRWDDYAEQGRSRFSPRLDLAWRPFERGVFRLAWGRYDQSQRTYEVRVEDGEQRLHPVERSEHRILGFERPAGVGTGVDGIGFRLEAYRREVDRPRSRYEDLFEPLNTFPEVEPARVRIAPDRGLAQGVELFVLGGSGGRARWWFNYTWARTDDLLDGRWVPRPFDQTHAVNLDLDFALGERWRLNAAWRFHTGWPTTRLTLVAEEDEEGEVEFVPVLGELRAERLSPSHRLDLRATRSWRWRQAALDFFIDVQNAYDRANVAGFDVEIDEDAGTIVKTPERWVGVLLSAGINVEF